MPAPGDDDQSLFRIEHQRIIIRNIVRGPLAVRPQHFQARAEIVLVRYPWHRPGQPDSGKQLLGMPVLDKCPTQRQVLVFEVRRFLQSLPVRSPRPEETRRDMRPLHGMRVALAKLAP